MTDDDGDDLVTMTSRKQVTLMTTVPTMVMTITITMNHDLDHDRNDHDTDQGHQGHGHDHHDNHNSFTFVNDWTNCNHNDWTQGLVTMSLPSILAILFIAVASCQRCFYFGQEVFIRVSYLTYSLLSFLTAKWEQWGSPPVAYHLKAVFFVATFRVHPWRQPFLLVSLLLLLLLKMGGIVILITWVGDVRFCQVPCAFAITQFKAGNGLRI